MTTFTRNSMPLLLVFSTSILGCPDEGDMPPLEEASTESGEPCNPGEQGCACVLGFCEAELACVADMCVDPLCQQGTELCNCVDGEFCFSGLECVEGLCQAAASESSDGGSSDGSTGGECMPNAYTQCVGESVVWFDSCGIMGDVDQICSDPQMCVNTSDTMAECQGDPGWCGNGQIDLGEDCDGSLPGSGICCDGCAYRSADFECYPSAETEYACLSGSDPGDDVSMRTRGRYCSGSDDACSGALGPWSNWSLADACSDSEYCSPGDSTCNACSYSYDVTQYECNNFSAAGGGNEIFRVCATADPQGHMTVKARKGDGSIFSNRPYQVRVSLPQDDPCGPDTHYFVISDSDPVGIGTDELTFSFPSEWLAGQTEKAYCVTASTKVGDLGYDANNPQQQSWWWSDKAVLIRECN